MRLKRVGVFFLVLFILVVWNGIGSAKEKETFDCSQAGEVIKRVGEYFRQVNRSYFELEPRERTEYLELFMDYFKAIRSCKDEILKSASIRVIKPSFWNNRKNQLNDISGDKFSLIFLGLDGNLYLPLLVREIFMPDFEIILLNPNLNTFKLFQKERGLEQKPFCYLETYGLGFLGWNPIIKCPYYRLEKALYEEFPVNVIIRHQGDRSVKEFVFKDETLKERANLEFKEMVENYMKDRQFMAFQVYETMRTLIYWLDKEFGERGRGLIRKR
ncbi:MAG: hypothetical protein QW607_11280 [Desulfurococcaceae archaeon]